MNENVNKNSGGASVNGHFMGDKQLQMNFYLYIANWLAELTSLHNYI